MNAIANPVAPMLPPRTRSGIGRSIPDPYVGADGDRLFEVVRGVRVEKTMGLLQNVIAGILYRALAPYCDRKDLGHAVVETTFTIPGSGNDRKPDVAFVSYQTWAKDRPIPDLNAWPVAPDLVVEVISHSDKAFDVLGKVHEYFAGGVQQVWQIYSNLGQVWVFDSPGSIRIYTKSDELIGDPLIPGFRILTADLFPLVES